jgi:hypothetical protein
VGEGTGVWVSSGKGNSSVGRSASVKGGKSKKCFLIKRASVSISLKASLHSTTLAAVRSPLFTTASIVLAFVSAVVRLVTFAGGIFHTDALV